MPALHCARDTFRNPLNTVRRHGVGDVVEDVRIVDQTFSLEVLSNDLQMRLAHLSLVLVCDAFAVDTVGDQTLTDHCR